MSMLQLLHLMKLRKRFIGAVVAAFTAMSIIIGLLAGSAYKATASVVISSRGIDAVTGQSLPPQMAVNQVATQADIIGSKTIARKVAQALKLNENETFVSEFSRTGYASGQMDEWIAERLLKNLDVKVGRESGVIDIVYKESSAEMAAMTANAIAKQYLETNIRLKEEPLRQASGYFLEMNKALRQQLEAAQDKLSRYQQEKGIVSIDDKVDVETARLNELSTQLVGTQAQLIDARSRQQSAGGELGGDQPDIMGNPLVQSLKISLALSEARFAQAGDKYQAGHPHYRTAKSELDKLRAQLDAAMHSMVNSMRANAEILQQREVDLHIAVDMQKSKVLALNRSRDELHVLGKEVEAAQRAYDMSTSRMSQTTLEGDANQADAALLELALPPLKPSGPGLLLTSSLAALLGALVAVMICLLREMRDRRIRSAQDLFGTLGVPVLGILGHAMPHRQRLHAMRSISVMPTPASASHY